MAVNGQSSSAYIWGLVRIICYLVVFKCFPWVSQLFYLVALSVFMRAIRSKPLLSSPPISENSVPLSNILKELLAH